MKFIDKIAVDQFEDALDNQQQVLMANIDRQNERVKNRLGELVGKSTAVGAGAGAVGAGGYNFLKKIKGLGGGKVLRAAGKGGLAGAALAGAGSLAYLLPKAYKAYVTRQEERDIRDFLDQRQDVLRENRIRQGAQRLKQIYARS